jgi:hypothetical protein
VSLSYSTSGRSDSFLVLLRSFFMPLFTLVRGRGILRTSPVRSSRKLATSSPGTERRGLYPSGSTMKLYPPDLTFGGCCSIRATVPLHTTR